MDRSYPDVPDYESPIEVEFEARCSECGSDSRPPHQAVARYPELTGGDPRGRERCNQCYAEVLDSETGLGKKTSKVVALEMLGYSHDQIASALGSSVTRTEKRARKARDTLRKTINQAEASEAVFNYL